MYIFTFNLGEKLSQQCCGLCSYKTSGSCHVAKLTICATRFCRSQVHNPSLPALFSRVSLAPDCGTRCQEGNAVSRPEALLRFAGHRKRGDHSVRSRSDGPFEHQGHVRYLRASVPGRGAEASGRFEKSMEEARVKSNADVSNRGEGQGPRRRNQLKRLVAGEGFEPSTFGL